MKSALLALTALLTIISISGCDLDTKTDAQKKREQENSDLQKKIEDSQRQMRDDDERFKDRMAPGGQPARISVYGIIVRNGLLEDRITLDVKTGMNRHGTYPEIESTQKPIISEQISDEPITDSDDHRFAIAFGCRKEVAESYAESRGLILQPYAKPNFPILSDFLIEADLAIFCGDPREFKDKSVKVESKEIIFDHFDYHIKGTFSLPSFQTQNLVLIGPNRISSNEGVIVPPASFSLTVEKGISSENDGNLTLYSHGVDMNEK